MNKTILVIDDNELNLKLACAILEDAGYRVHRALHARDALKILAREEVDLILMDILLPDMDGFHLTTVLKKNENTRSIPIVALTALAMAGDRERVMLAGCDGYIAKPIVTSSFLTYIANFLNGNKPA